MWAFHNIEMNLNKTTRIASFNFVRGGGGRKSFPNNTEPGRIHIKLAYSLAQLSRFPPWEGRKEKKRIYSKPFLDNVYSQSTFVHMEINIAV